MKRSLIALAAVVAAGACAPGARPGEPGAVRRGPLLVGYYAAGSAQRGFPPDSIRGELLTHIDYAFARIAEDGTAELANPCLDAGECPAGKTSAAGPGGNFAALKRLKARYPHLGVIVSFGGWGGSQRFSDAAATPESRQRFVASTMDVFFDRYPGVFDGVDLDWEYPGGGGLPENAVRPDDRANYTALAREFRRVMDERGARDGKHYLLTIAAPAGRSHMRNIDLVAMQEPLDWIGVMTYDYHTGGKIAHFNAPLGAAKGDPSPALNVDSTVAAYLAAGVRPKKIVVGVAFFGRGYGGVGPGRNGLFQPVAASTADADTAARAWGVGGVRYRQLADAESRGFRKFWEPDARVPWLYNPTTRVWISYDDPRSLRLKADLVRERRLGGIMIWELGGDDGTLLPALAEELSR